MSIFDKFKRKLKKKKVLEKKPPKKKVLEKKPPFTKAPEAGREKKAKKKKPALAYKILRSPYITEKSTELAKRNQYTFKVFKNANKTEIKKAIRQLYGVDVEDVKIIKKPSKIRRREREEGRKPGFKKAVVRIKQGQKIDVFPS